MPASITYYLKCICAASLKEKEDKREKNKTRKLKKHVKIYVKQQRCKNNNLVDSKTVLFEISTIRC